MNETPCCRFGQVAGPEFFQALAERNRIAILCGLAECCGGSKTVGQVAAALSVDLSVVSRHLKVLRDAGVVQAERRGKEVHYTARYEELVRVLRELADSIEICCPPAPAASGRAEAGRRSPTGTAA